MRKSVFTAGAALLLGALVTGCLSSEELPLAPNMVRLDVDAPAGAFVGRATLRRAAELTLERGYNAFRLTPIYMLAFDHFGVTVVMFQARDPGAQGAFDAAEVLGK